MAALGKQHGVRSGGVVPPAADEGDGHVVVADVLRRLHRDYLADNSRGDPLLDQRVEGRVPQDVADHDQAAVAAGSGDQVPHLLFGGGDGLLQEHVVTLLQERQGRGVVHAVHGAVDHRIGERRTPEEILVGGELALRRNVVEPGGVLPAHRVRLRYRDDAQPVRAAQPVRGVAERAVPRPDDDGGKGVACHAAVAPLDAGGGGRPGMILRALST